MIKFVYFDVGGVVIQDFSGNNHWEKMKRRIGITPKQDREFDDFFDKFESKVCVGLDVEELVPMIEKRFGVSFSSNYSMLADFVNHFRKNESLWPVIKEVNKRARIGLLTNMYPGMLDAIGESDLMPPVEWEVVIDSSIEKVQKPDTKIFELGEEKVGVGGKEILFVENSSRNIEAADNFGWQTFWYDSSDPKTSSQKLENFFLNL